jgi:SAM-dependent methyltransferase
MNAESKLPESKVRDKEIEESYGSDYLKWKSWGEGSSFGKLKKQEEAYFAAELRRTQSMFSSNSKVLEIGFGNGSFLKYAKDKKWDVFGTEINEYLVRVALESGFNVIHSDNLTDYNENIFDLVVAFDVLEHIPQSDLPNFISEVKRILKKGGVFIARFPNGDSPFGLPNQNGDITHITTIGTGKVYYFAAQCDMDIVFVGGEAQPLFVKNLLHFAHRLISVPIKKLLHLVTKLIFFPRSNISFYSSNLTLIYKKSK